MNFRAAEILPLPVPWDRLSARALLTRWLRSRPFPYALGAAAMLLTNISEAAVPKIIEQLVDLARGAGASASAGVIDRFHALIITLLGILIAQALGRRYWRLSLGQETHRAAAALKNSLWLRARYFPRQRLERDLSCGALMNVATGDVSNGRLVFGWTLIGILDFVFLTAVAAAAMHRIDPGFTALAFGCFAVLPCLTYRAAQREYQQHQHAQTVLGRLNDLVAQAVSSIKLQRLSQSGRFWTKRLMTIAAEYRLRRLDVVNTTLRFAPLTGIPPLLCHAALFSVGISAVFDGSITVGQFVALQSYIVLMQGPLAEMGVIISEWQRSRASLERITTVLSTPLAPGFAESAHSISAAPVPGAPVFRLENVAFRYPESPRQLLHGLSLEITPGERLGITGPIGSGKTTLLNILTGNEHDFTGTVLFHGVDVRGYSHAELSRTMTLVEQRPFLFAESIRLNVLMNRPGSDEEVWRYLELAGLKDDVARFTRGLDSPLGEWGINLSGGQKQRLTIARALAAQPKVLLLDDCLSAVDVHTEERILEHLDAALPETTIIWAAHRASTLRLCSRIVRLAP